MDKYTNEQLEELAKGAFKSSPGEKCFYASGNGSFLNEGQYNLLTEKQKADFKKFENPNLKAKVEKPAKPLKPAASSSEAEGPSEKSTLAELKEYAKANGIELTAEDKTKAQILEKIKAATPAE